MTDDTLADADVAKMRAFSGIMADELERCGKIISGLLSFSRETHNAFKDLDLNEVISSVVDLIRHRIELQDLSFRLEMAREPLFIHGDTNQLQQCFLNLVFNAIEAMGPGGRLEVVSTGRNEERIAEVQIQDTGHGIPRKHLNHIYDPFFTTKAMGEGTGMGLSIVYGVVKNHQGKIKVHSDVGKGTTFTIQFPLTASKSG